MLHSNTQIQLPTLLSGRHLPLQPSIFLFLLLLLLWSPLDGLFFFLEEPPGLDDRGSGLLLEGDERLHVLLEHLVEDRALQSKQ